MNIIFVSLKTDFVLANNVAYDEMPCGIPSGSSPFAKVLVLGCQVFQRVKQQQDLGQRFGQNIFKKICFWS